MSEPLLVFVSSLMEEFRNERVAVKQALESIALARPWVFEFTPAASSTAERVYVDNVLRSDLFVLLIGRDMSSAVEQEVQLALVAKKPILAFLKRGERTSRAQALVEKMKCHVKLGEFNDATDLVPQLEQAVADEIVLKYREQAAGLSAAGTRVPAATVPGIQQPTVCFADQEAPSVSDHPDGTVTLTWSWLKERCRAVSATAVVALGRRFDENTYVQRQAMQRRLDDFVQSSQTAMVITRSSGIGKSSFLYHWYNSTRHDQNKCVLLYLAQRLDRGIPLLQQVSDNLLEPLCLPGQIPYDVFWHGMAAIMRSPRHMVMLIDALNEHDSPVELLKTIDRAVEGIAYPWLKIVLTCRSSTWALLEKRIYLAYPKYFVDDSSTSVELTEFSKEEVEDAYQRYRKRFDLKSEWEGIDSNTSRLMRDPLSLKLLAKAYMGHELQSCSVDMDLYPRLVRGLVAEGVLRWTDIQFLEDCLVPIMATPGSYCNYVSGDVLRRTTWECGHGRVPLYDLIPLDGAVNGADHLNSPFVRLVNAEILALDESTDERRVFFKYERVYDYFLGKHFHEKARQLANPTAHYLTLSRAAMDQPFLWGSIRNALTLELHSGRLRPILDLAKHGPVTSSVLASALTQYGKTSEEAGCRALQLMARRGTWEVLVSRMMPRSDGIDMLLSRTRIVLEASRSLQCCHILADLMGDSLQPVAFEAMQCLHLLWLRACQDGLLDSAESILGELARRLAWPKTALSPRTWRFLPNYAQFSLMAWIDSFGNEANESLLARHWLHILHQLLPPPHIARRGISLSERAVVTLLVKLGYGLVEARIALANSKAGAAYASAHIVDALHLDRETSRRILQLVDFLEEGSQDFEAVKGIVIEWCNSTRRDPLFRVKQGLMNPVPLAMGITDFERAMPILREVFERGNEYGRGKVLTRLGWIPYVSTGMPPALPELFKNLLLVYLAENREAFLAPYLAGGTGSLNTVLIGYTLGECKALHQATLLREVLVSARQRDDLPVVARCVRDLLYAGLAYPQHCLSVLEQNSGVDLRACVLECGGTSANLMCEGNTDMEIFRDTVFTTLGSLRLLHPQDVDSLLSRMQASPVARKAVLETHDLDAVGEYYQMSRGGTLLVSTFLHDSELRRFLFDLIRRWVGFAESSGFRKPTKRQTVAFLTDIMHSVLARLRTSELSEPGSR